MLPQFLVVQPLVGAYVGLVIHKVGLLDKKTYGDELFSSHSCGEE